MRASSRSVLKAKPRATSSARIDEMKFRSSMTLFARAAPDDDVFQRCIDKYFAGSPDPATLAKV